MWQAKFIQVPLGHEVSLESNADLTDFATHLLKQPYVNYRSGSSSVDSKMPTCHALLFSTGFDSTACLYLNPSIEYCFYICRKGIPQGLLKQDKALDSFRKFATIFADKKFYIIETDVEKLRSPYGYIGDFGMAAPLIPYLHHFGITHLNFGMIGDIAHLQSSRKFRNLKDTPTYRNTIHSFAQMGIQIVLPTALFLDHVSKTICQMEEVAHLTSSCIRGTIDKPCGKCRKCFKEGLNHDKDPSYFGKEQLKIFEDPPKMFYLFSAWRNGTVSKYFPNVQDDLDLSWVENFYYPKGWVCEDVELSELIRKRIEIYLPHPTDSQTARFEALDTRQYLKPHS